MTLFTTPKSGVVLDEARHLTGKTWNDAASLWLAEMAHKRTIDHDRRKLEWLRPQIGQLKLIDVDRHIIAAIAERKLAESSPSTANRYLALIRAIVRKAAFDWEWIHNPPRVRLVKEPGRRVRWLTPDQVRALLHELEPHQRDACLFALATGLRHSNVAGLRWAQVDFRRKTAWLYADQTKNNEDLHVSLNETALQALTRQRGKHPEYVFTYKNRPIKRFTTKSWYQALKRAQITNFRWHDLRHTWASWLVQEGVPLYSLQEMGGWKTASMVRKYAHLSPSVNLENARKIDVFLGIIPDDH